MVQGVVLHMSNREAWKSQERYVAAMMGGKRVPVTGRDRGDVPDILHPSFSVEVKAGRNALSAATIKLAQAQAHASSVKDGKEPISVHVQTSGRGKPREAYVVWKLERFCDYFGLGA